MFTTAGLVALLTLGCCNAALAALSGTLSRHHGSQVGSAAGVPDLCRRVPTSLLKSSLQISKIPACRALNHSNDPDTFFSGQIGWFWGGAVHLIWATGDTQDVASFLRHHARKAVFDGKYVGAADGPLSAWFVAINGHLLEVSDSPTYNETSNLAHLQTLTAFAVSALA